MEHRRGEGCGLVYDDAVQDTVCPSHALVDGSIPGDYCREHDLFGCALHHVATAEDLSGEYEAPARYELPVALVETVAEYLRPVSATIDGDYTAPAHDLTDTEILDRIVSCMPTINIDRAMGNRSSRTMLIQLTGNYDDVEWIRTQLLKRAAARPPSADVAIVEARSFPPVDKRLPW